MGWWSTTRSGASFTHDDGPEMLWGDGPADFLDDALTEIRKDYEESCGRPPTCGELRAGLEFSLMGAPDDMVFDEDFTTHAFNEPEEKPNV